MNERTVAVITFLAALLVLFSAMLDPRISLSRERSTSQRARNSEVERVSKVFQSNEFDGIEVRGRKWKKNTFLFQKGLERKKPPGY